MAQFDTRLNRIISTNSKWDKENSLNGAVVNPFNGVSYVILGELPNPDIMLNSPIDETLPQDKQDSMKKGNEEAAEHAANLYDNEYFGDPRWVATDSIMNPYTVTRLYGAFDKKDGGIVNRLVDSSVTRKYYEIDGDASGGYAKNPTTAAIIKWGAADEYCRTPYQFQDFVFCKYWNKIPNNRLLTLRRYPLPILDNLNYPGQVDSEGANKAIMHPLATMVGYFGEETENKLSDMLKFSTGMEWEEIQSQIWDVEGRQEGMDENFNMFGAGGSSWVSSHATQLTNVLGVLNPKQFNASAAKGLPPDPWSTGTYVNKVLGPVNVIDKVYKRKRGLKFTNDLNIKFHYVARPIGGINSKAVLLDILANTLVMGSASAQFFGGAHKFNIAPIRYPFNFNKDLEKLYRGDIYGATTGMVNHFMDQATSGGTDKNHPYNPLPIFKNIWRGFTEVIGDALEAAKEIVKGNFNNLSEILKPSSSSQGVAKVVGERLRTQLGTYPYLTGMKALFTGQPVGDWHLTIGNPMNPIAMIGNLICDNVEVQFGDELGPDDFPLEFTVTISLKHGMPRDRDSIEAMFNRGAGRIYDISDDFNSSADSETAVDTGTGGTLKTTTDWKAKTKTGPRMKNLTITPGYASYANGKAFSNENVMTGNIDNLNSIASLGFKNGEGGNAGSVHILNPKFLKNIM